MRVFHLELGESKFRLELAGACAELLPAFYPTARLADAVSESGRHGLAVESAEGGFRTRVRGDVSEIASRPLPEAGLALFALEEIIERQVIAEARELLALHGGAVSTPAGTCLLLGDSDAGKSSTTFQLLELGAGFLCEEITLCDPGSWEVVPYPQTLSLSRQLLDEYTAEFEVHGHLHRLTPPLIRYRPSRLPNPWERATPVARVLLPRFRSGAATTLESVASEEALTEVLGYSFPPNVDTETQFDRMIGLLEQAEVFRFTYAGAGAASAVLSEAFGFRKL